MDLKVIGISAALCAAASWAIGAILFKKLGETLSSLAMTLLKGAISIVLLAAALAFIGFESIGQEPLLLLVVSGLLGIAVADTCFFEALQDLGPHSLVLLHALGQVLTVLFAVVFLRETRTPVQWLGIVLVVSGVTVVLRAKLLGDKKAAGLRGLTFGLLSVVCMSVSFIIAKKALDSVSAIHATFIRMVSGTMGVFLLGIATRRLGSWVMPFNNLKLAGRFLLAVCVVTFGGFWLSLAAIKYVDVSIATPLISTEPLFVLPFTAIFLKEKITLRAVAGTIVTILGIIFLCVG